MRLLFWPSIDLLGDTHVRQVAHLLAGDTIDLRASRPAEVSDREIGD